MTLYNMTLTDRRQRKADRAAHVRRMAVLHAEAQRIVNTGVCPDCGTPLRRNTSMTGWWQCGAYGTPSFRQPEHRDLPPCSFQCFTA